VALLSPLSEDEQTTFIVVSLPEGVLRKLVGRLGTAPKGTRLDAQAREAAAAALASDLEPMSSAQGSAKLRLHLQRVLTNRALQAAMTRAAAA
jgi:xanthine dehydrogenase iron-sulfur cluster and FAD-binding subunit A